MLLGDALKIRGLCNVDIFQFLTIEKKKDIYATFDTF